MFCLLEVLLLLQNNCLTLRNRNDAVVIRSNFLQFSTGYYGRLFNQIIYNLSPLRFHFFGLHKSLLIIRCVLAVMTVLKVLNISFLIVFVIVIVLRSDLQTVFQDFSLDFGAISHQEILHMFLHGVDYVNHVSSIISKLMNIHIIV